MPLVWFEPTIPVFEWAEAIQALDRAATVIDFRNMSKYGSYIFKIIVEHKTF
jgi:hypothetical protein